MVKERRYVFDIQDLSSLIYACPHCGHEAVCSLQHETHPPARCGSCEERLMVPDHVNGIDPAITLLQNLRKLLGKPAPGRVRVRLVVPDPD